MFITHFFAIFNCIISVSANQREGCKTSSGTNNITINILFPCALKKSTRKDHQQPSHLKMAFRQARQILLFFVIYIVSVNAFKGENGTSHVKQTEVYSSVIFECPGEDMPQQTVQRWEHDDKVLYAGRANVGKLPGKSMSLSTNYSLVITNVSYSHEGNYQCFRNSERWTYLLIVTGMFVIIFSVFHGDDLITDIDFVFRSAFKFIVVCFISLMKNNSKVSAYAFCFLK